MSGNVYDTIDPPKNGVSTPAASNAYDTIDPRKESVTAADRVQALEGGILRGGASLATLPFDTVANLVNLGRAGTGYATSKITGHPPPSWLEVNGVSPVSGALTGVMDRSPITTTQPTHPEDMTSRYAQALGAAGIGALAGGGGTLAGTSRALAGTALPAAAGQTVTEARPFGDNEAANNAASAVTQLGLGAGVPLATSALAKALLRGSTSPATMQRNVEAFSDVGAQPSLGQATGNRAVQFAESALSKIPGGAGVMDKFAERQAANIGKGANSVVSSLAEEASPEAAGRAIQQGVTGPGGALENFKSRAKGLYDAVDKHIAPESPASVKNTLGTLETLTKPVPGAEQTSALLVNPKISQIREALMADLGKTEGGPMTLPYQTLAGLRSQVGDTLGGSELITGVSRAQLKRLYGSLSQDMQGAAENAGPEAVRAFHAANDFYRQGADRMDMLNGLIDKQGGPEAVFNSALSGTKYGASRLREIYDSIGQDQGNVVTASVLKRMGLASPGAQGAAGDSYSPQAFLTNWNKMSPEAKDTLFGPAGGELRSRVDHIAHVSENIKSGSKVFANPSGTAAGNEAIGTLRNVIGALEEGALALGGHAVGGLAGAGLSAVGVPAAAYIGAKTTTSPGVVNWAASPTRIGQPQLAQMLATQTRLAGQPQPPNDDRQRIAQALLAAGRTVP